MCIVTVFTPTYNRLLMLQRLYKSLEKQTLKMFEWVIVDDGSNDGTYEYLLKIKQEATFDMTVIKQKNAGKHVAINKGVSVAEGKMFFIVDSDDYLCENAIESILDIEAKLPDKNKFAGISGLRITPEGKMVGTSFEQEFIDCTAFERDKYNITGDKAEVYFTDILKRYPFPVFEGENFLTESVVWYRIANDGYKVRWTNAAFYICDYQKGGLSDTTGKCSRCFKGYQLTTKEFLSYKQIPFKLRIMQLLAYSAIAFKEKKDLRICADEIEIPYIIVAVSARIGLYAYKAKQLLVKVRKQYE